MCGNPLAPVASWSNICHPLESAAHNSVDAVDMISFDFQQNLPTPNLQHNDMFYARQLWTYIFGIHDCVAGKGYRYMWDETVAKRGSLMVASCPKHFFHAYRTGARSLLSYSDGCGGQIKTLFLLASTTNFTQLGSMTSLTMSSSQGVIPSSGTTLTSPKSRRGRQVPQCTFQVIGSLW